MAAGEPPRDERKTSQARGAPPAEKISSWASSRKKPRQDKPRPTRRKRGGYTLSARSADPGEEEGSSCIIPGRALGNKNKKRKGPRGLCIENLIYPAEQDLNNNALARGMSFRPKGGSGRRRISCASKIRKTGPSSPWEKREPSPHSHFQR